jgi:aspartyl-tRNA(Asn)/glutamyl-tRNA(Gln) amidotransferase subunit C
MSLTQDDVRKVAHLARLKMNASQLENVTSSLNNIMQWIEQLDEVQTDSVKPLVNVSEQQYNCREDVADQGLQAEDVLGNSEHTTQGFFSVPKVVE